MAPYTIGPDVVAVRSSLKVRGNSEGLVRRSRRF